MSTKNPVVSLIVTIVFIFALVSLMIILANVFVIVAIIGLIIFSIVRIKNKLFPKPKLSPEERLRQFADKMNQYQQYGYSEQYRQQQNSFSDDLESQNEDLLSSKPRGRIIDVEPEK